MLVRLRQIAVVGVGTVLGPVAVVEPGMVVVVDELAVDVEQAVKARARRARAKMVGRFIICASDAGQFEAAPSSAPYHRLREATGIWT